MTYDWMQRECRDVAEQQTQSPAAFSPEAISASIVTLAMVLSAIVETVQSLERRLAQLDGDLRG